MTESELLFTEMLNCDRTSLYLNRELCLDNGKSHLISSILKRRIKGEPIQYILGRLEFMGLEFRLTPDVFIPRPETEILVETVSNLIECLMFNLRCLNILEIGTGSGCIAISLAKFLPSVRIIATDISTSALKIAEENSHLNKTEDRIQFIQADIFNIKHKTLNIKQFDIIVSNPPYIPTGEIKNLEPELAYEPRISLDGGRDGLDFYRRIIQEAPTYLNRGKSFLILEMGYNQCSAIKELFNSAKNFRIIEIVKDYNNIDRVIVAQYKS
jgi:release factor glutamine methyltransferase